MTFAEMYARALSGHTAEMECLVLSYRFGFLGEEEMTMSELARLEQLADELDLDLSGDDTATWTPDMEEQT